MVITEFLDPALLNEPKYAVVFAYLCKVKTDYAYNISKEFSEAIDSGEWNNEHLKINSYLRNNSNLLKILNEMTEYQLIYQLPPLSTETRNIKYYTVNLMVFQNDLIFHEVVNKKPDYVLKRPAIWIGHIFLRLRDHFSDYYLITEKFPKQRFIQELNQWKKFDFYMILDMISNDLMMYWDRFLKIGTRKYRKLKKEKKEEEARHLMNYSINKSQSYNFLTIYFSIYLKYINRSYYRKNINISDILTPKVMPRKGNKESISKLIKEYIVTPTS